MYDETAAYRLAVDCLLLGPWLERACQQSCVILQGQADGALPIIHYFCTISGS